MRQVIEDCSAKCCNTEAIANISNKTTAIEEATAQLANILRTLVDKVETTATQQALLFSSFTELKDSVRETQQTLSSHIQHTQVYDSCADVLQQYPSATSGYYSITFKGNKAAVYCDMEGTNCGGEGGWMRIANVDMTQYGGACPTGLNTYSFSGISHKLCDYLHNSGKRCDSTIFSTYDIGYSKVCGRVRGYRYGNPDGIYNNNRGSSSIDSYYVDGVSITRGSPRQHVWTFVGGQRENRASWVDCPCNTGSSETLLSFVGSDYYCESASSYSDPLWDGQQCNSLEAPCCTNPNLPYFKKTFSTPSTDDIELRICGSEGYPDEATPVDIIELYVR